MNETYGKSYILQGKTYATILNVVSESDNVLLTFATGGSAFVEKKQARRLTKMVGVKSFEALRGTNIRFHYTSYQKIDGESLEVLV